MAIRAMKLASTHSATPCPRPMSRLPERLETTIPASTPCTLRRGPPQVESKSPPSTPPTPAAVRTMPMAVSSLPVRLRIMAGWTACPKVAKRLSSKKVVCRPSRLGRARM